MGMRPHRAGVPCGSRTKVRGMASYHSLCGYCYLTDHDHDWLDPEDPIRFNSRLLATPTRIGDDCWLGEKVAVLRGVTIGRGCIIGAHSVVTRDLPERTVAVGAPARVIRRWDDKIGGWVAVGSAD